MIRRVRPPPPQLHSGPYDIELKFSPASIARRTASPGGQSRVADLDDVRVGSCCPTGDRSVPRVQIEQMVYAFELRLTFQLRFQLFSMYYARALQPLSLKIGRASFESYMNESSSSST